MATVTIDVLNTNGPPVSTDDPLTAGITTLKAAHTTELRDAVDRLRAAVLAIW
jgi:hypothetical protein